MFHPFALTISSNESSESFAYIFEAVRAHNAEWQPEILLADGSEAITRGFQQVFGDPVLRLMCNFHAVKNVEKCLKDDSNLRTDLNALQVAKDRATFQIASTLFLKKWRTRKPKFVEYLEDQWISKNTNWYEGIAPGKP